MDLVPLATLHIPVAPRGGYWHYISFYQHYLAVPFSILPHLKFRFLILNKKIVIHQVQI